MSFSKEEIQTLGDLNYIVRSQVKPPQPVIDRLLVLAAALKADTWRQWSDPDRGYILGLMASTVDGKYWRALLDRFAGEIGVTIQEVTTSTAPTTPSTSTNTPTSGALVPAPSGAVAVREMRKTTSKVITDPALLEVTDYDTQSKPMAFLGEVGFGGAPLKGHPVTMRKGGEIVILADVPADQTQEKRAMRRAGFFSYNLYDNGIRFGQGGFWHEGILHRVQDELRILGMDSAGTVSQSYEDYSQPKVERGQDWIIRRDVARKKYVITICKAGWGVEIAGSTQSMNDHNPNPNDRSTTIIEPIMQSRDIDAP